MLTKSKENKLGFTVIELVVVTVILAILAGMATLTYAKVTDRAKDQTALASLVNIGAAASASYMIGQGTLTWADALAEATQSTFLGAQQITPTSEVELLPSPAFSLTPKQLSYATSLDLNLLNMAVATPTGGCAMVVVNTSGVLTSWITGKIGANCNADQVLLGKTAAQALAYISPLEFGPPSPVTKPQVTNSGLTLSPRDYTGPTITFIPSVSSDVTSVIVLRDSAPLLTLDASANSFQDTKALPGTTYTYTLSSLDQQGLSSTATSISYTTIPGEISSMTLTNTLTSNGADLNLAWTNLGLEEVSGYNIYLDGMLVSTLPPIASTTITDISPNVQHTFLVLPFNTSGEGVGISLQQTFTDLAPSPTWLTVTAKDAAVTLVWSKVTSATGYQIFRNVSNGPYTLLTQITPNTTTTYTDLSAENSVSYSYQIASYTKAGVSSFSAPTRSVTPSTIPSAPTITSLSGSTNSDLSISFTANSDGGSVITSYTLTSSSGQTVTGASSPLSLTEHKPGAYTYTVQATNNNGTSFDSAPVSSFEYSLGDTGPGGGIIFYVAPTPFACGLTLNQKCSYLEAAPIADTNKKSGNNNDNNKDNNDNNDNITSYQWSDKSGGTIGAIGIAIGTGYYNTMLMLNQNKNPDHAGAISQNYRGPNNKNDWFLPSIDELKQLYSQKRIVGGFLEENYWSSSEKNSNEAWMQDFNNNGKKYDQKSKTYYVRPVRAF